MRPTTPQEKEVLTYLNDLRDSGQTNMFGAGQYIQNEFGISRSEAGQYLTLWMENFNEQGNYEEVKDNKLFNNITTIKLNNSIYYNDGYYFGYWMLYWLDGIKSL